MAPRFGMTGLRGERGQATLLLLGAVGALLLGALVLASFGQALGARGRHQRAADLAAMSAARVMATAYPKLFVSLPAPSGRPLIRLQPQLQGWQPKCRPYRNATVRLSVYPDRYTPPFARTQARGAR
jgi:hypothetical protein